MPFTEILPPFLTKQKHSCDNNKKNATKDNHEYVRQQQQRREEEEDLFVEAFAVQVEPQRCGPLIRQLQNQETELQHLKRVKNIPDPIAARHDNDAHKRQKVSEQRLVLLGTDCNAMEQYLKQYTIHRVLIPKRPPNSESEWNTMNEKWPTKKVNYLAIEQEQQARRIQPEENRLMEKTIQQIVLEEKDTVLLDPSSGDIVGRASVERRLQLGASNSTSNPLQTDILYAIQNVSRRERTKRSASYLCTGFDLYTIQEPSLFEGMAALHSRVRRIMFVHPSPNLGALTHYSLHTLTSTNHHFRAFRWNEITSQNH